MNIQPIVKPRDSPLFPSILMSGYLLEAIHNQDIKNNDHVFAILINHKYKYD